MKIAYVANVRMPTEKAHGVQIMQMCRAFSQVGHEVTLVVPARRNTIEKTVWEFYGVEPSFQIVYVPIVDFITWDKWLGNLALWLETLWFGLAARRVVASLKPDVVYSRDPLSSAWVPSRFRRVFEAHDFPNRFLWLYRQLWRRCDRIVALTAGLRDRFASFGLPTDRLVVAHDAVDPERFECPETQAEAREALHLPQGFMAVYVGALYPQKGSLDLLEAARHVSSGVKIAIVGGTGELLEQFQTRAAELKLTNVFLPGQVPHAGVALWLRAADVAVLPNRGGSDYAERYTSPMKLFEYLAAGLPVVTSDLPTVREVLQPDEAVFTPPEDPGALAERLNELSWSPAEVIRLEEVSRRLAQSHTWRSRAEFVLSGIESL
jgi:glycosyltransferase involved in cell wall biosynthesis